MDTPDLRNTDLYINRQISLLEFSGRVLQQANDGHNPLLERLKFLCIASSNLDEFFEIRVAGLKQAMELGAVQAGPDNRTPQEVLKEVSARAGELVAEQYETHAKMIMVVRREGRRLLHYTHLGTGNYHSRTARLYTDYGLLTADRRSARTCTGYSSSSEFGLVYSARSFRACKRKPPHPRKGHAAVNCGRAVGLQADFLVEPLPRAAGRVTDSTASVNDRELVSSRRCSD